MRALRNSAGERGQAGRRVPGLSAFLRDDRGAISVEFTVLVPFFVLLLVFFADATVIYLTHSEMFNTARELSRRMATGQIQTQADAEAYVADKLFLGQRTYYVWADFNGDKSVALVVDVVDAAIFGHWFRPLLGRELVAIATVGEEPRIE